MSNQAKINELIKKYDLDALDVSDDYFYISCGRGLTTHEFNELNMVVKELMESRYD